MPTASGFQVAILIFAFQFFTALIASRAISHMSWPRANLEFTGQVILFCLAIVVLAAVPALRRFCLEELRRPLPPGGFLETSAVTVGKIAIPFAVSGAAVIWAFALGEPSVLATKLRSADPLEAWSWTLSPPGLVRMVVLSWVVGPVVEELVFRGLLYRAWERQWGWIPALVLTSSCFALFHPSHMVSAFLGSVVYVCLLRRTGTLRASILMHMTFNFLISWPLLGQYLLTLEGRELARMSTWTAELASLVFVAIALPVYLALSRADVRAAPAR
jgi:membrane protease YdiL (CAAX protease family)